MYANRTHHQRNSKGRGKEHSNNEVHKSPKHKEKPIGLQKLRSTSGGQWMVLLHHILPWKSTSANTEIWWLGTAR